MKQKTTIRIVASIAILACANMAEAQWTQYHGANGTSWGTANRMGNTTYFNNANGTAAGRATTMGNTTYYYNATARRRGLARLRLEHNPSCRFAQRSQPARDSRMRTARLGAYVFFTHAFRE